MSKIMDVAAAKAQRTSSGPTLYRQLRDTLTDDGSQFQLVARVGDDERFLLVTRDTSPVPLVERINERNKRRHEIDAALTAIDAILTDAGVTAPKDGDESVTDEERAAFLAGLPPAVVNALADRATLTAERKGLPKIDTDRAQRVARALVLYDEQDSEK